MLNRFYLNPILPEQARTRTDVLRVMNWAWTSSPGRRTIPWFPGMPWARVSPTPSLRTGFPPFRNHGLRSREDRIPQGH